ncbi:hephaestin-like [Sphaerodactylus townsendi]|uniref:hephaestin-like n=1 Tax=Sphaerodactylus townsendi TaxID=933632 RepID=UPI00202726C3|nr:hephaestin-like [Sphaerodactylus townsendi]
MHAINGFLFSNLPDLDMCKGEKISWHLLGLGTETDVHGVAFQGNTVLMDGMRKDTMSLFPHTFATALMQTDSEGTFEVYCQTSNHYQSGMRGRYSVQQCGKEELSLGRRYERVRTVYIMAEEVEWDYTPDRSWELEWHNGSGEESYDNVFLSRKNGLLGSKYKKAVYREYTDGTFKTPKNRSNGEEHLGILGLSGIPLSPRSMASLIEEGVSSDSSKTGSAGSDALWNDKSGLAACDPYLGAGASRQTTSSPILGEGLYLEVQHFVEKPPNQGTLKCGATSIVEKRFGTMSGQSTRGNNSHLHLFPWGLGLLWMGLVVSQQPFQQMGQYQRQPEPEVCRHHFQFSHAMAPLVGNQISQLEGNRLSRWGFLCNRYL